MVKGTVKARQVFWMFALSLALLVGATWLLYAVYSTQPSQLEAARAMLRGDALPARPAEPNLVFTTLLLVLAYAPAVASLIVAIFLQRRERRDLRHATI